MWLPSSAVAEILAAVSPGSSVRLVAKSITRVRLSWLNGTGAVVGNGSTIKLVDSTATARVELDFVSNTGAVARRARVGNSTSRQKNRKIAKQERLIARPKEVYEDAGKQNQGNGLGQPKSRNL